MNKPAISAAAADGDGGSLVGGSALGVEQATKTKEAATELSRNATRDIAPPADFTVSS